MGDAILPKCLSLSVAALLVRRDRKLVAPLIHISVLVSSANDQKGLQLYAPRREEASGISASRYLQQSSTSRARGPGN